MKWRFRLTAVLIVLLLAMSMMSVAAGEGASSALAETEATSAEVSSTGSPGGAYADAAEASTTHTDAEVSSAGSGWGYPWDGASASSASASTPSTSAESSSASVGGMGGGASSSSSYSSTTTTTTTTTSATSSTSTSAGAGGYYGGTYYDPYGPWLPVPPKPSGSGHRSSGSSSVTETIIQSEDVTGKGWTLRNKVNVRSMPSTKAGLVIQISSVSTEVMVNAKVLNSKGETWYAVKLYQGYVGYIRGDLLRVELTEETPKKDEADETIVSTIKTKTNGSPKIVYVIVEPTVTEEPEEETQVIYITPEQAQELGILDGSIIPNG